MIKFFRDNQPVIANRLLGALEDFLALFNRIGPSAYGAVEQAELILKQIPPRLARLKGGNSAQR